MSADVGEWAGAAMIAQGAAGRPGPRTGPDNLNHEDNP